MNRRLRLPPLAAGLPLVVLAGVAVVSAVTLAVRQAPPRADLVVWTFAQTHADSFTAANPSPIEQFEQATGRSVSVELLETSAMDVRLLSLLRGGLGGDHLPDVLQLETLSAAKFLDAPPQRIGLLSLDTFLDRDGLRERVVPSRFATWQRHGQTYGIPVDVHPVTLTYRRDLFEAAGIDPSRAETWPELAEMLRSSVAYWRERGETQRVGLELARTRSDHLSLMLQQQGIALITTEGKPNLTDPRIVDTILFYTSLLQGPAPPAGPTSSGHARFARDLADGRVAMVWTPDWRVNYLRSAAPELAGKLAMMPLPRFAPSDAPTAVWGGTMLGIPKDADDPETAWALLRHLAFSDAALEARRQATGAISPIPTRWRGDAYSAPDPYFGGQLILALYAHLAQEAPLSRTTALSTAAAGHLAAILSRTADARAAGTRESTLRENIRRWLSEAQADLEERAAFLTPAEAQ